MKKKYSKSYIEMILLEEVDIITTSDDKDYNGGSGKKGDGDVDEGL